MTDGLNVADVMALTKNDEGAFGGSGTWIWVFFLFFLLAWGGNGFGFGGNNQAVTGAEIAANGALTRADLYEGFTTNDIQRQIQGVQQGISDLGYTQNTALLNGFNTLGNTVTQTGYGIQSALAQNRFDSQLGTQSTIDAITQAQYANQLSSCNLGHQIEGTKYEAAKNTSELVSAIQAEGAATRALINQNAMQDLRDRLESRDRDLMVAQIQVSQQAQTSSIIEATRPTPIPAYPVCSPYQSYTLAGCGCGNY